MISSHGFSSHPVLSPLLDYGQLASNNEDSTYRKEEAVRHCCNFSVLFPKTECKLAA